MARTETYTDSLTGNTFTVTIEKAKHYSKWDRRYYVRFNGHTLGWMSRNDTARLWDLYSPYYIGDVQAINFGWEETLSMGAWRIAQRHASSLRHLEGVSL